MRHTRLKPRIVIIGGGFGGLYCARGLAGVEAEITLIDRRNHHLFQPLLYQVATAGLSPAQIAAPIRSVLGHQKNLSIVMAEVHSIDTRERRILADKLSVPYDYLVIATGAQHSYFGHDEWAPFAPGLKSLEDATRIRARILTAFEEAEIEDNDTTREALMTFAVVGAGPTGVELAGAIAEIAQKVLNSEFHRIRTRAASVLLIEAGPRILTSFPESLSKRAEKDLEKLGVRVMTSKKVENVDANGLMLGTEHVPARTVLWAAGVKASPAGTWLNTECDRAGRVKVDASLRLPAHPNIFVIGDTASVSDNKGGFLPGVAPVAIQQGQYLARQLREELKGHTSTKPFVYFNKGNLATIGRSSAIADFGSLKLTGFAAWILWSVVHILYLAGFRNRFFVSLEWLWSYLTFQRGARLITQERSSVRSPESTSR